MLRITLAALFLALTGCARVISEDALAPIAGVVTTVCLNGVSYYQMMSVTSTGAVTSLAPRYTPHQGYPDTCR